MIHPEYSTKKTEDTEVLGGQTAKPSTRPTCKNCLYHCAPL